MKREKPFEWTHRSQIGNVKKELFIFTELKGIVTKEKFTSLANPHIWENRREKIIKLGNTLIETNQPKEQREKSLKQNEKNLRDFWNNIKCSGICVSGVSEGEEKKKGSGKINVEKNGWNLGKSDENVNFQIQELQWISSNLNTIFHSGTVWSTW